MQIPIVSDHGHLSTHPWPLLPQALCLHLGLPGQELAPGVVDTTWKQGAVVETA